MFAFVIAQSKADWNFVVLVISSDVMKDVKVQPKFSRKQLNSAFIEVILIPPI